MNGQVDSRYICEMNQKEKWKPKNMYTGNFPKTQRSVTEFSHMTNHRETAR